MKKLINKLIYKYSYFFDLVLFLILLFSIPGMYVFVKFGSKTFKLSRELLKKFGVFPIKDHYYYPLFKDSRLKRSLREPRFLPGIDFCEEKQLLFLESLTFSNELIQLKLNEEKDDIKDFYINNTTFESGDAEFLYQFIRLHQPKNVIEIGSGNSTKIAHKALRRNQLENGINFSHVCVEPFEMPWLECLDVEVLRSPIEDCNMNMFNDLGENDLLFIDSSHMIRPQGDVLKEYLEIIPSLKSGVMIHVHDIFTPRDYPDSWIREEL